MIDHTTSYRPAVRWRALGVLAVVAMCAVILVLPYLLATTPLPSSVKVPLPLLLAASVVQSTVQMSLLAAAGLWLGPRVGLGFPGLERRLAGERIDPTWLARFRSAAVIGAVTSAGIIAFLLVFPIGNSHTPPVAWWKGLLASFYGGIVEETMMRLGVMTLVAVGLTRFWHTIGGQPKTTTMWISVLLAALLFGVGHLPLAMQVYGLTPYIVATVVIGNAIGGIVFGWLYWRRGLGSAMVAHFTADLVLHVAAPLLVLLIGHS